MKKAAKNFKTTSIKGKQYVEVKERIKYLAEDFSGEYSINTSYQYFPERKMWVVKAILKMKQEGNVNTYTGLAQEIESDSFKDVNYTSALENAETSAIGRACAFAGIGIDVSIASVDEINKAMNRAQVKEKESKSETITEAMPAMTSADKKRALAMIEAGHFPELAAFTKGFTISAEEGKKLAKLIEDKKAALKAQHVDSHHPENQAEVAAAIESEEQSRYATAKQKEEIIRLLNNVLITRQEKTAMLLGINKLSEEKAAKSIQNLIKSIEERGAAANAEQQATPEMQARNTAAGELYQLATRNSVIIGDARLKEIYDLCNDPIASLVELTTYKEELVDWLADQEASEVNIFMPDKHNPVANSYNGKANAAVA